MTEALHAVKEIPLSQGKLAIVDDEDFAFLSQWRWYATKAIGSRTWYACRNVGRGEGLAMKTLAMHRVIMRAAPGQSIDHADHDGLNNTRANLRFCTHAQNSANSPQPVSMYGYRGISPSTKRWRARIRVNGRQVPLGTFNTREEAAEAYDRAAVHYYGSFAILNFPKLAA